MEKVGFYWARRQRNLRRTRRRTNVDNFTLTLCGEGSDGSAEVLAEAGATLRVAEAAGERTLEGENDGGGGGRRRTYQTMHPSSALRAATMQGMSSGPPHATMAEAMAVAHMAFFMKLQWPLVI